MQFKKTKKQPSFVVYIRRNVWWTNKHVPIERYKVCNLLYFTYLELRDSYYYEKAFTHAPLIHAFDPRSFDATRGALG